MKSIKLEQRLQSYVNLLGNLKDISKESFDVFYSSEVDSKFDVPKTNTNFIKYDKDAFCFKKDSYYWFKFTIDVKKNNEYQKTFLSISSNADKWLATRPQGLLFVNGKAKCGIDVFHNNVFLNEGHYVCFLLLYTHDFNVRLSFDFCLKTFDERILGLLYDLDVPLQGLKLLLEDSKEYELSCDTLEPALNILDFRSPYSDEFYNSIKNCKDYLLKEYYGKICGSDNVVKLIGHTHIDLAWLWDLEQTKQKAVRSFSTVLMLMNEHPEYRFMTSQPQLLQFVKENKPDLYDQIKAKILDKKWEVDGGFYLESDTNLVSGESLVRQFHYGKEFYKKEFNIDSKILWLPDVFGYSGQLPQIASKSGVDTFITAKIGWNDTNRFPYDFFNWEGIDNSRIFTYLLSTCFCDPRSGVYDRTYTSYSEPVSARALLGTYNRFQQKKNNNTFLMSYGYGDGGGGPEREDLEKIKRLSYGLPGLPKCEISSLNDAVNKIKENFSKIKKQPHYKGELYFEFHRGTLTSVPEIKWNMRRGEFNLMNLEFSSTLASLMANKPYDREFIDKSWKVVLLNQFHDIVPGSSISKVYDDSREQFKKFFIETNKTINENYSAVTSTVPGRYIVFNNTGFKTNGIVSKNGEYFIAKNVPSHGYKSFNLLSNDVSNVKIGKNCLENSYFKLSFNDDGSISSLYDKRINKELVPSGKAINKFVAYEDIPHLYDNWELEQYHFQKKYELNENATFKVVDSGCKKGFEIEKKYYNSKIIQKVFLFDDGIERIDFETKIIWNEENQLLKVEFPTNIKSDFATYDIQFGNVKRSTKNDTKVEQACFESVAHKWVDLSQKDFGLALLNDGKYGFNIKNSLISMTLVKSGRYPNYLASKIIPEFTYSLMPHDCLDGLNKIVKESYVLNNPLCLKENNNDGEEKEYSFVYTKTRGISLETIKKAFNSDEVIVRLFEFENLEKSVEICFANKIEKAEIVNLLEEEPQKVDFSDNVIKFEVKPFEIITLKIKLLK